MNVQIEGRHLRVTTATRDHVLEKVEPLSRYFDGLHDIRVVLVKEDEQLKKVEIICGVVRGKQLVAKASHENLSAALDQAVHKTRELLKKFKGRLRERKRDRWTSTGGTVESTGGTVESTGGTVESEDETVESEDED